MKAEVCELNSFMQNAHLSDGLLHTGTIDSFKSALPAKINEHHNFISTESKSQMPNAGNIPISGTSIQEVTVFQGIYLLKITRDHA